MNRRRPARRGWAMLLSMWLGVCFLAASSGCDGCRKKERAAAIARLTSMVGDGITRDYAERPLQWQQTQVGAELGLGDGARTDARSTAELTFVNGATLALKPGTTVRLLLDDQKEETALDVQSGEAILHAGKQGVSLRTHVGLAMIEPDSEILLRRSGDALGFEVALGQLNFKDREATQVGLAVGDSVDIGIGMAVLELKRAASDVAPVPGINVEVVSGMVQGRSAAGLSLGIIKHGGRDIDNGTQLRLQSGAEVLIKRGQERVRLRGPGDFTVGVERALAEGRRGEMFLEAVEVDVEVRVPGGVIVARRENGGTQANVRIGETDGALKVLRGTVETRLFGKDETVVAGAGSTWTHGAGLLEDGGASALSEGPAYRHMTVRAGESFSVHTPTAPVAVGFDFSGKCPGEALLEQAGGRQKSRAKDTANLAFAAGTKGYTVRCIGPSGAPGRQVARGTVHVLIDAGTRRLPARAPTSNIDADGRTYNVYYQNQLPDITVRWTNPPAQASYQLEVDGKPMQVQGPEHTFRSGQLKDGRHTLSFAAQGRRSRTTTVEVSFDNAAPKASLGSPDDRGFHAGDKVTVEGVALPTWKVSLDGGTIAMSGGDRFSGTVQTSTERPDIAVRLSHPRLGTHIYLRRASGSP